jgi:hypothetical protein
LGEEGAAQSRVHPSRAKREKGRREDVGRLGSRWLQGRRKVGVLIAAGLGPILGVYVVLNFHVFHLTRP